MWQKLVLLAIAGALGTLARYAASGVAQRAWGGDFPWGTLVVNLSGCILFGLVWGLAEDRALISNAWRTIVLVGFMGAFTTFSTYIFETEQMLRDGQWILAGCNLVGQNVLGLIGFVVGFLLAKIF